MSSSQDIHRAEAVVRIRGRMQKLSAKLDAFKRDIVDHDPANGIGGLAADTKGLCQLVNRVKDAGPNLKKVLVDEFHAIAEKVQGIADAFDSKPPSTALVPFKWLDLEVTAGEFYKRCARYIRYSLTGLGLEKPKGKRAREAWDERRSERLLIKRIRAIIASEAS